MTTFSAKQTLAGLKPFQKRTVKHVFSRFYSGAVPTDRFLVADETGLGKSMIAAGIVARVIEHLESDSSVDRIDIVYMCSNKDLARQNIARVNVTGQTDVIDSGRLALLPLELRKLNAEPAANTGKRVNFISLTPGTSFNDGQRLGNAEERAALFIMLETILGVRETRSSQPKFAELDKARALDLLRGNSQKENFAYEIERLNRQQPEGFPKRVVSYFRKNSREKGLTRRFKSLLGSAAPSSELRQKVPDLIRDFRSVLAEAGLECLEPDLIILDEFQRFQDLLYGSGDDSEVVGAAELARQFLTYGGSKLLLLSATPYKAHTTSQYDEGEDHAREFSELLAFLSQNDPDWITKLNRLLGQRRRQLTGLESGDNATRLANHIKKFMCRTERPQLGEDDMLKVVHMLPHDVRPEDLRSLGALTRLSQEGGAGNPIEYWKSVPYFANFMGEYRLGKFIDGTVASSSEKILQLLPTLTTIDRERHRMFLALEGDNAKYREAERHILDDGLWKLLWMPPSCPYTLPSGAFAEVGAETTKQVLFSSWNAAPNAISTLLSYEVERRLLTLAGDKAENTAEARARFAPRLSWRMRDGEPQTMSALALFVPHAKLAGEADPLKLIRGKNGEVPVTSKAVRAAAETALKDSLRPSSITESRGLWAAYFGIKGSLPSSWKNIHDVDRDWIAGEVEHELADFHPTMSAQQSSESNYMRHIDLMLETAFSGEAAWREGIEDLALNSPANCVYRALGRILPASFDPVAHWAAALFAAEGLRTLFNRQDTTALLDHLYKGLDYWQAVLRYCEDGNLQSVLDEYAFQLRSQQPKTPITNDYLWDIAEEMRRVLSLKAVTLRAKEPGEEGMGLAMPTRFAVRYGNGRTEDGSAQRTPDVRAAFNSPFWPFVLTTTSVGQEGIDFHWWCHSVMHWNVPGNPVDFEQREGRVHRYMGHAVRKNVAAAHRDEMLSGSERNPWSAMFRKAESATTAQRKSASEFAPYWVYGGEHRIERRLLDHPLSRDVPRTQRMLTGLAHYRLALGQARQEDLLETISNKDIRPLNLRP